MAKRSKIRIPVPEEIRNMEYQYNSDASRNPFDSPLRGRLEDPHGNLTNFGGAPGTSGRIEFGVIVQAIPHLRNYVVKSASGRAVTRCIPLTFGSGTYMGSANSSTLAPGTPVCIIRDSYSGIGFIIGAVPKAVLRHADLLADRISQYDMFRVGNSTAVQNYLKAGKNSGVIHCGSRSPIDSAEAGEFCVTSDMGGMLFLDSFMGFLRMHEECGIWMFQFDDLMRIVARNLQEWLPGFIREVYTDQDEIHYYEGTGDIVGKRPTLEIFRGYPAFSEKKVLRGVVGDTAIDVRGLIEEGWSQSAIWSLLSLRGFILSQASESTALIDRAKRPFDPAGDSEKNYNSGGKVYDASFTPHHWIGELKAPDSWSSQPDKVKKAISYFNSSPLDKLNYHTKWEMLRHFAYHDNDFSIARYPGDREYPDLTTYGTNNGVADLETKITLPSTREETKEFTASKAGGFMIVNEDGSVHIGDGYGASIRMEHGRLYISAPEVFIESGRNMAIWAGKGLYMKGRTHVELVSSTSSVSVKAQTTLRMLGGNDETSPVLLESKGGTLTISGKEGTGSKKGLVQIDDDANVRITGRIIDTRADHLRSKADVSIECDFDGIDPFEFSAFEFDSPEENYVIPEPLYGQIMRAAGSSITTLTESEIVGASAPGNKPWGFRDSDQIYQQDIGSIPSSPDPPDDGTVETDYGFGTITVTTLDGSWPYIP